jgi:hypothetical protein
MIAVTGGFEGICALRLYIWTAAHSNAARFFPESERTGQPVGGRPHSTGPGGAGAREATGDGVR